MNKYPATLTLLTALLLLSPLSACTPDTDQHTTNQQDNSGSPDTGFTDTDTDTTPEFDTNTPENRPSEQVADITMGDPLEVDDTRREAALESYENLNKNDLEAGFSPDDLYEIFNEFALTYFGPANQPLIYEYTGELLDFLPDTDWIHVSQNSATIGFETTLPVLGHIKFSTVEDDLSNDTTISERYFFNQLHHLRDLEEDTTYYYRLVARADDGEIITSHTRSFTTKADADHDWVHLPGDLPGPPFLLDQPDTTYLLTEDITADHTALVIEASNITVDLNGHRITYANEPVADVNSNNANTAASGIYARSSSISTLRILNGRLQEGHIGNQSNSNGGLNPIYLSSITDIEIAGLSMDYHAAQLHALFVRYPEGRFHLHHNRFTDRGFEILDRHGAGGGRPLRLIANEPAAGEIDDFEIHHNLIARTRQSGLMRATTMEDNEIYVDSWTINSFAMQPYSKDDQPAGTSRRNKLFLTGYNAIGFGWAHLDLMVEDNLIQMEGVTTDDRRYSEDWGEDDAISAFRITNYGSGGQVRHNLVYRNNTVLGRARGTGTMRGTMFFTDTTITDTQFVENFVHITAEHEESLDTTPVVAQGVHANRDTHRPAFYTDNILTSNIANVRFGDSYGRGNRHIFTDTTFTRTGDHPDYHTFVFDKGFHSTGHELIDPTFENGAAIDDVWWRRTSTLSEYSVFWTLSIDASPSEEVSITDASGTEVFSGTIGDDRTLAIPLKSLTIRPSEWTEDGGQSEVQNVYSHQKISHTPHQVTLGDTTESIDMDQPQSLTF